MANTMRNVDANDINFYIGKLVGTVPINRYIGRWVGNTPINWYIGG